MEMDHGHKRVFSRLGSAPSQSVESQNQKVCFHWRAGRCNRNPCLFRHEELPHNSNNIMPSMKRFDDRSNGNGFNQNNKYIRGKPSNPNPASNVNLHPPSKWGRGGHNGGGFPRVTQIDKVCKYWMMGKCNYGDACKFQHQWFTSDSFSFLTQLTGHTKAITSIAFPLGSAKLYSGSKDESVRVWDCETGQCTGVINLGSEIGCMISEGPWIFVGIQNAVKAWNTQTTTDLTLNGPVGLVYSLVVGNGMLFAGTHDGNILAWKAGTNDFEPAAALQGHSLAVISLVVGANRLYSGSMDHTIKVWDLETLSCIQTLTEHTSVVMSVLCWEQFLLSCSLDKTIKVWAATDSGNLEVTYTHKEENGLLALCGMHDTEAKPVLICPCNDNTVRLYDLPSFNERGKIYSKEEIRSTQIGPGGLFFTGDGTGELKVWKCTDKATSSSATAS
ncbi:hypothetical protein GIB67_040721 [Kingdonia uniflora]|uniref:C3H1-type domain-containing protein n=1 Tax=Kingdonia uniflora TaxID=39325 RepID=A0A7J7KUF6_9MAGN|nr:hypothetical protein GIB67_040721 [Kingdonia uniflora]